MSCCSRVERVGRDGYLRLVFERRGDRTVLAQRRFALPLQALEPSKLGKGALYLMLLNPTGGIFGGDRLRSEIILGEGTHVVLTTPSASKIYRSRDEAAYCETKISLGADAILEYLPDHLIPHPGAAIRQKLRMTMAPGSCAIVYDGLAAGRVGRDERWQFRELSSEIRIDLLDRTRFLCRSSLLPASHPLATPGLMDGHDYLGSIIALRHGSMPRSEDLKAFDSAICSATGVWGGATVTAAGVLFAKFLTSTARSLSQTMQAGWRVARERLIGLSAFDLRKL